MFCQSPQGLGPSNRQPCIDDNVGASHALCPDKTQDLLSNIIDGDVLLQCSSLLDLVLQIL